MVDERESVAESLEELAELIESGDTVSAAWWARMAADQVRKGECWPEILEKNDE